jgi:diguanylate cyclase (GGDEF)-like protein/PAS domain S-box-containing protein
LSQPSPKSAGPGASDAVTALAITENIPVGTYVMALGLDHPPRFTFVSDRWLRMLQLERQAVLADPSLAFQRIHPDDWAPFTALHELVVAEVKPLFWEGRLLVHGVTSWVRIESIPRPNPAGGTIWEGVMVDITSQQQSKQELERERALLHTVLSHIDAHVYMKDRLGRYLYANPSAQRLLTGGAADVRGRSDFDFLPAEVAAAIRQVDEQVLRLGVPSFTEETLPARHGGGERVFLSQKLPYRQPGQPDGLIGFSTDITELRRAYMQLAESEEHYRLLAENMSDVVFRLDGEGRILWVSPSLTAALGWQPEEWIGRLGIEFLPHRGESETFRQNVARLLAGENGVRARDEVFARDGSIHWVETQADPYRNACGEIEGIVSSFRLIDEQVATEKQLQHLATTDGLTGIANRRHLELLVNHEMERGERTGESASLILCDIDNFKAINDLYGHHVGDQVLVDFSRRILRQVRRCDAFGRWGGEEFLLLLPSTGRDAALALAQLLCQGIAASDFSPVGTVTASFGVAQHRPQESQDAWLQRLDAALYAAKAAGRNGVHAA